MTVPYERWYAVVNTEKFLLRLCNPKETPKIPSSIRSEARSLLRHYPSKYYMERAAGACPDIFEVSNPFQQYCKEEFEKESST